MEIYIILWLLIGLAWTLSQWKKAWSRSKLMGLQKWFPISVLCEIILWPIGMIGAIYIKYLIKN